ncbi:MAG: DNA polymerase III subunit delta' [Pseudomonadota bacterium]
MPTRYPWQHEDWSRLQALRERLPSALLIKGGQGIGKFDLAMAFAQSLLCRQIDQAGDVCGQCEQCLWFTQASHPDFRLLQPDALSVKEAGNRDASSWVKRAADEALADTKKKPGKDIPVDKIRSLSDFVNQSSHQRGKRIVVIYPAEMMNVNAANALLKSLEEAAEDLLFILVTHKPQQLLPTILSRCMSFTVSQPPVEIATRWLKAMGVSDPDSALALSGFSPLVALGAAEIAGSEARASLLRALRRPVSLDVFALAETLQKTEQVLVVQWLQQWSFDLNMMKAAGRLRYHLGEETEIKTLVEPLALLDLARLSGYLQTAKREAQHTLNPKLFLESLLFSYRRIMLTKV